MRLLVLAQLCVLLSGSVAAIADDRGDIEAVIDTWNEGWRAKNAQLAAKGYSDDAEWINAFGMRERGRASIATKLQEVFSLPFVMSANSRNAGQEVRLVAPGVAVVITQVERQGQTTPSGEDLGVRHTTHQRVLVKRDGHWLVVSHLISDARDPRAARH